MKPRVGYLFSRYPLLSQTFCDNEMLGLEDFGWDLAVGSIYPPEQSLRQRQLDQLIAPLMHSPSRKMLKAVEARYRAAGRWPEELIAQHEQRYGKDYQPEVRALYAAYFSEQFERLGVTHLHCPFANRATHAALFLKEITDLPFSFTTHGQDFMVDLGSDELLAEMCEAAEFVVAVCDYSRDRLAATCPDSAEKIVRVYNGMNPERFSCPDRSSRAKNKEPLQLVSVGRLIEFKGFEVLIDAVAQVNEEGIPVELSIIGTGPLEDSLREQIKRLGLGARVRLEGQLPTEEVFAKMDKADAFALACIVDSKGASDLLPTVIVEAMFSGLPCLSTTVAGVPEMIIEGETGRLLPPGDVGAMAAAITELSKNPEARLAMGVAGRELAVERFSYRATTPQLGELFQEAGGKAAPTVVGNRALVFYDLDLRGRDAWLRGEAAGIRTVGGRALVSCGEAAQKTFDRLGHEVLDLLALPDGMVLEMEWRMREEWRRKLEQLRMDLAGAVDGTRFLKAARRAVWIALQSDPSTLLVGAGSDESVAVWLARQLVPGSYAVCYDRDLQPWGSSLLRRMAKDAAVVSDSTGKVEGAADELGRFGKRKEVKRIAFARWKKTIREPDDAGRSKLIQAWLKKGVTHE